MARNLSLLVEATLLPFAAASAEPTVCGLRSMRVQDKGKHGRCEVDICVSRRSGADSSRSRGQSGSLESSKSKIELSLSISCA